MTLGLVAALVPGVRAGTDDGVSFFESVGEQVPGTEAEVERLQTGQPPADVALDTDSNGGGDSAAAASAIAQVLDEDDQAHPQPPAEVAQTQPETAREQVAVGAEGQDPVGQTRQDQQLSDVPGCGGEGCSKAPLAPGGPTMVAIGGSPGGGPPGGSEERQSLHDQLRGVLYQVEDLHARLEEVIEWRRTAQREEYDADEQAALEAALVEEMGPTDKPLMAAELARISQDLQRLEPRVGGETPEEMTLELVRRKIQEVSERLRILPMSSVRLDLLSLPGQQILSGNPAVPDPAGYGSKETTVPDLTGYGSKQTTVPDPAGFTLIPPLDLNPPSSRAPSRQDVNPEPSALQRVVTDQRTARVGLWATATFIAAWTLNLLAAGTNALIPVLIPKDIPLPGAAPRPTPG
jgi:hypothetical protein